MDGLGGGISSLSKVVVVRVSERDDADIDYTFGQVGVGAPEVDYSGNCGNLSAGVVPFALSSGVIGSEDGDREFRLFNTNTGKFVHVCLTVQDGQAVEEGDLVVPGVAGSGSAIALTYTDPAGSKTTALLPTGSFPWSSFPLQSLA